MTDVKIDVETWLFRLARSFLDRLSKFRKVKERDVADAVVRCSEMRGKVEGACCAL